MWVLFVIIYALLKGARECMKKGAFEIVEVTSIVYELLEEDA